MTNEMINFMNGFIIAFLVDAYEGEDDEDE